METTHLSNSQNVGCRSDYVCDEFGDDETDEDGADAGDKLSDSDVYKLSRMNVMRKPCLRAMMIIKSVQGMSYSMHIY